MKKLDLTLLSVVALAIFMTNMDASIVYISTPILSEVFNVSTSQVSWVVLSYLLSMAGLLLVFGRLSDIRGPEEVFKWGFCLFILATFLCGIAGGLLSLSIFRFIQGAGAAMLMSSFGAIIIKYTPSEMRGRIFGIVTVCGAVGFALGAPIGGMIMKYMDWRWIFFINIPFGVVAIFLSFRLFRNNAGITGGNTGFDLAGGFLSLLSMACFILYLNQGQEMGWMSPPMLICLVLFLASLALFVVREKRIDSPLLDFSLFSVRNITLALLAGNIVVMLLDGFNFLFPYYFMIVKGWGPEKTGSFLMLFPLISMVTGPVAGVLADRFGSRPVCVIADFFIVISVAMFAFFGEKTHILFIVATFLIFGVALAMFFTANASLVLGSAPKGREGITSALNSFATNTGAILGVSIFEAIFSMKAHGVHCNGGYDPFPVVTGFQWTSYFGIAVACIALIASFLVREKEERKIAGEIIQN